MSDLYTWSTTAASNNSTPPDGWPEGMAPNTVNNTAREMMRAIKAGTVIWWSSVTAMRAITTNPGTDSRHVLLDTTSGKAFRFYKWVDTKSGSNNGLSIVSPTGTLSAGAFEQIGMTEAFSDPAADSLSAVLDVSGVVNLNLSLSSTITFTSLTGGFVGQEVFVRIKAGGSKAFFDFASGSNLKGNAGAVWRCQNDDFFWFKYDGTNWFAFTETGAALSTGQTISNGTLHSFPRNNLDTIHAVVPTASTTLIAMNGGAIGTLLELSVSGSGSQPMLVLDGSGNLQMAGNFTMSVGDALLLSKIDSTTWVEVSRSKNA